MGIKKPPYQAVERNARTVASDGEREKRYISYLRQPCHSSLQGCTGVREATVLNKHVPCVISSTRCCWLTVNTCFSDAAVRAMLGNLIGTTAIKQSSRAPSLCSPHRVKTKDFFPYSLSFYLTHSLFLSSLSLARIGPFP